VRNGTSDEGIATAIANIWHARGDRYSQLRGSANAASTTTREERRVEMSYIGG
jgi:cyclic pyranopterin phosphate synthase